MPLPDLSRGRTTGEEDFASLTRNWHRSEQLFISRSLSETGNRLWVFPVPDEPPAERARTKPGET